MNWVPEPMDGSERIPLIVFARRSCMSLTRIVHPTTEGPGVQLCHECKDATKGKDLQGRFSFSGIRLVSAVK